MLMMYKMIIAAALIALCLSVLGIAYYSSQPSNSQSEQQSTTKQTTENKNGEKREAASLWQFLFPDSISVFTFCLVVATALMAFVSVVQIGFLTRAEKISSQAANAAQRSADIAKDTLQKGARAFVFPRDLSLIWHLDESNKKIWWEIKPIWENSGNTPTRNLHLSVNSYFESADLPSDFNFPPLPETCINDTPVFIGPKATIGGSSVIKTGHELMEVRTGKKFFYIWGSATYRDVFDQNDVHITRFAYRVNVFGDPSHTPSNANVVTISTALYSKHNCSDEECEYQDKKGNK